MAAVRQTPIVLVQTAMRRDRPGSPGLTET